MVGGAGRAAERGKRQLEVSSYIFARITCTHFHHQWYLVFLTHYYCMPVASCHGSFPVVATSGVPESAFHKTFRSKTFIGFGTLLAFDCMQTTLHRGLPL